jgi:hypothetical protein
MTKPRFTLTFEMGNAAFADGEHAAEVARILRSIASRVEEYADEDGNVYDYNGNHVGQWDMTPPEAETGEGK